MQLYLFVSLLISTLITSFFIYYILSLIFNDRKHGILILVIYTLYGVYRGYDSFQLGWYYLFTLIGLIPGYIMIFRTYPIINKINKRRSTFNKQSNKERMVISKSYIYKKYLILWLIVSQIAFITLLTLTILDYLDIEWYYFVLLELSCTYFIYLKVTTKVDEVIFIKGVNDKEIYQMSLQKSKTLLKEIFIDDNYIIDSVGKITIKKDLFKKNYYVLLLNTDPINYKLNENFKPCQNNQILNIINEFKKYEYKEFELKQE